MNANSKTSSEASVTPADTRDQLVAHYLSSTGNPTDSVARRLQANRAALDGLLDRLAKLVVPEHLATVTGLIDSLQSFSTRVSLVGQVKAGKTMLTNALTGLPGMLPSDVNPWTSAVTSIHINTPKPRGANAVFTFYTADDWRNLTEGGGHLGQLARRADFANELAEMRRQVVEMQRRTEERLGTNFALLLGSQHKFNDFNRLLLEKYVCLGEMDGPVQPGGRYADVTKAADLYIDSDAFALPTTISDTPGVNDPFLARERATLTTLSGSDICVIVLSAHQAMATVDLALINILLAFNAGRVVLFVNRIDELQNPDAQIPEIDAFIRGILTEKGIESDLPIVYGSAAWSELAQLGPQASISPDGIAKLEALALARSHRAGASAGQRMLGLPPYNMDKTRDLSGLHELKGLIEGLSIMNVAAPVMVEVMLHAADVAKQSSLVVWKALNGDMPLRAGVDASDIVDRIDNTLAELDADFINLWNSLTERMLLTMSSAFREFIDRESEVIRSMVSQGRRLADWSPGTEALRRSLNQAYHNFMAKGNAATAELYAKAAKAMDDIYARVLQEDGRLFAIRAPAVVEPNIPPLLMRTMAIDMKSSWVGNWLARLTGANAVVARLSETVTAEMTEFLDEMRDTHLTDFVNTSRRVLHDFLADHLQTLQNIANLDGAENSTRSQQRLGIEIELKQRMVSLKGVLSELQAQIDAMCEDFGLSLK